ncbi:hypothetical protein ALC57_16944 [Trachymyrmex cornetzi]|uniref:Mos1 transposase HTH domain-containing protein n=1 Tax=Trachymyrmex cornetzi TaxID=471704 RepID=A0A151ITZ7_9HYME|nr:hypothetical protein ALC57_16944 [Trachymyrmex cornetzi]
MSVYEPNSRHLREVLIFCFNMKKPAAHQMLSNTYGEAAISERTCSIRGSLQKMTSFFRRGIRTLPERWEKVVASDGQYFES